MGEWSNLTQREKSNIIRFAIKNGVSDINQIRDTFNVYAKDSLANVDYNMAAAKASGFGSNGNGHYPDTFKKPNHPTFSDESIYHSEATPGGRWRGNTYEPSEFVLNQQGGWNNFLKGFYGQEQGTSAVPVFKGGVMLPEIGVRPSPKYKKSSEAYYDPETDTVFAPDSTGEFYTHERFHARPNKEYLQKIAPYYENLNDSVLTSMGADLPFINRNGDPGQYYSPEEIGARVAASLGMLKKAGVSKIDSDFVKESRKNELKYGDNYRDLLHMYNDDIITNLLNSYANGGSIHIAPSKRGTFTAAATKHGKSVQEFARQVLANKENYSPAMVKKANFAKNFGGHRHDGLSDTQYLRTEQPKVVMPVTGKTADTSWYEWWFANRQKQLQQNIETVKKNDRERDFTKYLISYPNSAEEDTERMIKALGETKEYVGNAGMMEDSIGNALARNLLKHQISDYTPDIPDYKVASYLSYLQDGVHLPAYNAILYPDIGEQPSSTTVTHERAHAADAFFPRAAIDYFTTSGEVNPERYDTWYKRIFAPLHPKYPLGIFPASGRKDYYLDDPNEVYSRLMEFRQFVGANPNYTWTKEDLKKYERALEKFRLRRYSDEDILKLLNEIAQNNSSFQKSDNTYLAALGGNLKSTGGPLYPFSFQKNPYWKTPVVRYDEGGFLDVLKSVFRRASNGVQQVVNNISAKEHSYVGLPTTDNRPYNPDYMAYIERGLTSRGIDGNRLPALLGTIAEESGGNPFAISPSGAYQGLVQWGPDRYVVPDTTIDPYEAIDLQLDTLVSTLKNAKDRTSWTHGGTGSGYNSKMEPFNEFWSDTTSIPGVTKALNLGYIRPGGKHASVANRTRVAQHINDSILTK